MQFQWLKIVSDNVYYPAKPKGHRRVDLRRVLNGILCRLRSECQWNRLPREFGDASTIQRHCQHWYQAYR